MKNIVVLCGGRSSEHEIALRSAKTIINELDRGKYRVTVFYVDKKGHFIPIEPDLPVKDPKDLMVSTDKSLLQSLEAFCSSMEKLDDPLVIPCIHGQTGEDGEIQGFLQTLGLNYTGCRLTSSAICMDKSLANQVFESCGLPQAKFITIRSYEWETINYPKLEEEVESKLGWPVFVKPANNGSSIGVHRADKEGLRGAIKDAFLWDSKILIEEAIEGCEVEVSVLGNEDARASLPGSYSYTRKTLDYTAKYNDKTTQENVPAPMSEEKYREVQDLALRAYHALDCEGLARVDIFMDKEGRFFVNEINTFPGMTVTSLAPKLWTALTDMTMGEYLDTIIEEAEKSRERRSKIKNSWEGAE